MKIISLQAENFKRLTAVEITPDGNLVEICGDNGQGKTSVLDAIFVALAGTTAIAGQPNPIRTGVDEAVIRLDLGELIVRRHFKRKGDLCPSTLTVEGKDGAHLKGPQGVLDALIGSLSFDPLEFQRMCPVEQAKAFSRLIPGFDFDADEAAQRGDFARRAEFNRTAKDRRAAAANIIIPEGFKPIDEDALAESLAEVSGFNEDLAAKRRRREAVAEDAAACRANADGFRDRITVIDGEIEALRNEIVTKQSRREMFLDSIQLALASAAEGDAKLAAAPPLPEPMDSAKILTDMAAARKWNAQGARAEEKARLTAEAEASAAESTALTDKMAARETAKRAAIAAAKLPVEGIAFDGTGLMLNGEPFAQASDAEQLRTSIAIAMASNSRLRVIRVRDGSLLGDKGMRLLAQMADAADYQVWIERVDTSGAVGIVIEDGAVRAVLPAHAAE